MDMRYHWLRDRVKQKQFDVQWCQGHTNISDYLTKDLPHHQFRAIRPIIFPKPGTRKSVLDLPNYKKKSMRVKEISYTDSYVKGVCSSQTETSPQDTLIFQWKLPSYLHYFEQWKQSQFITNVSTEIVSDS